MTKVYALVLAFALTLGVVACSNTSGSVTGPSTGATLSSLSQLAQSTIAVLDGTTWMAGWYTVSKYPNYPSEPPSPTYFVHIGNNQDPCTVKWPGYETNYRIDHDDDYFTPEWHWCQLDD